MMKRLLLAAALSLATAGSAMAQTVYLVRHAEKADASADPALSEAGLARAVALATALEDAHPDRIFTSPLQRTRQTAAPTADFHSAVVEPVSLDGGAAVHVAAVVDRVRALPDDAVVLVVGHSNTIPLIARALGYAEAADMPECEYDRMTILHLTGDTAHGQVSSYGAPTACQGATPARPDIVANSAATAFIKAANSPPDGSIGSSRSCRKDIPASRRQDQPLRTGRSPG